MISGAKWTKGRKFHKIHVIITTRWTVVCRIKLNENLLSKDFRWNTAPTGLVRWNQDVTILFPCLIKCILLDVMCYILKIHIKSCTFLDSRDKDSKNSSNSMYNFYFNLLNSKCFSCKFAYFFITLNLPMRSWKKKMDLKKLKKTQNFITTMNFKTLKLIWIQTLKVILGLSWETWFNQIELMSFSNLIWYRFYFHCIKFLTI